MLGAFLATLSAATFAFNNAATRRGVLTASVLQALSITVPIGVPIFLAAALLSGNGPTLAGFPPRSIQVMALVGVLHFVCGRYCNYRAVKAIGANLSAPLIQLSLVVTLVLAVVGLGERLTPLRMIGIVLVVLGPALMRQAEARSHASAKDAAPGDTPAAPKFTPLYAEGYIFSLLSAVIYGITPIMVRTVVERGGVGSGVAAGVISYAAGSAALALVLLWPGQWRHVLAIDRGTIKWFATSGVFVCLSQMFIYMAYAVAPVSVVTPILQLQLVFRYVFARLLNPHHEVFGGRIVIGTAASLLGAVALSISTEFVLELLPLPDGIIAVLRWEWP